MLEDAPGARWEVYSLPKRYQDVMRHRTVLAGLPDEHPANPVGMVYGAAIGPVIHGEPWEPGALRGLYDYLTTA